MISLTNVHLKNFRGHKDTDINFVPQNGMFFIFGDNGNGKTTIMNAINWCLFGDIVFQTIYNDDKPSIRSLGLPSEKSVEVSIQIVYEKRKYQFRRVAKDFDERGTLSAIEIIDNNSSVLSPDDIKPLIHQIIPENIRDLFFLNGDNFSTEIFSKTGINNLKNNIYKVSELDTINNAIRHLGLTENRYLKNISRATADYDKIQDLTKIKEADEKAKENLAKDIELANTKIKEHEDELEDFKKLLRDTEHTREIIEEKTRLEKEKDGIEGEIFSSTQDISECIKDGYSKLLLRDGLNEYRDALNEAKTQGVLPAPVNPKVTRDILDSHICVCGRHIGPEEEDYINKQHERYVAIKKKEFLADGIYEFSDIDNQIMDNDQKIGVAVDRRDAADSRLIPIEERIAEVKKKLNGVKTAQIDNPDLKMQHIEWDIEKWKERRRQYNRSVIECDDEIKKCEKEITRLLGRSGGDDVSGLNNELQFIRTLKEELQTLRQEAENTIRKRLEKGIWETYLKIMPETQFSSIKIDEDYNFVTISKSGLESGAGITSVGELKTMALSLIYTLSSDIGYSETPLFIDNLFGGIEKTHFSEIAKFVGKLSEKKQIFITYLYKPDSDSIDRVSNYFEPKYIQQEFNSCKDQNTGICTIKEEVR